MEYVQTRRSDNEIWQNTKSNLYWQAEVWVVPVHLPDMQHWVVCTVYIKEGRVMFFDSFAEQMTLTSMLSVRVLPFFLRK